MTCTRNMLEIWNSIAADSTACTACNLHATRNNVVVADPSEWDGVKPILIIGEAPGADEDDIGLPFVGKSGRLLRSEFHRIGIRKRDCAIINCIQCRPPENRDPMPLELCACKKFFSRKIEALKPSVLVLVGKIAAKYVLKIDRIAIAKESGTSRSAVVNGNTLPAFILCHPAYALRGTENLNLFNRSMDNLATWIAEHGISLKKRNIA